MLNRITLTIISLFIGAAAAFAQAPNMFNYQGVARSSNGNVLANQNIALKFSIRHSSAGGTVQYSEVRNATTDATGLFNVQIGSTGAVSTTGSWGGINWKSGTKFLQVEMDPAGGSSFVNLGTQQLISVPFAMHATSAASLTPSATVTPSQIGAGGASANQVLQYNGTAWVPATVSAGGTGFNLPVDEKDSLNSVLFDIENEHSLTTAHAVRGTANGFGVMGHSTGTHGIYGSSSAPNSAGVFGGAGAAGSSGVIGQHSYNGNGVYGKSLASGSGVRGEVTGTSGNGVLGVANIPNGYGVQGSSTTGTGVLGYSNSNVGVYGSVISGVALKGYSLTGYGLDVTGKVKIAGGNTNPGNGKVLTSDASGNAVWKDNKIGFAIKGIRGAQQSIGHNAWAKILFDIEDYDYSNSYNSATNAMNFTAPVTGVYHFDAGTNWYYHYYTSNLIGYYAHYEEVSLRLMLNRGGTVSTLRHFRHTYTDDDQAFADQTMSADVKLQAGDIVWLEASQMNDMGFTLKLMGTLGAGNNGTPEQIYFNGHLVFAD